MTSTRPPALLVALVLALVGCGTTPPSPAAVTPTPTPTRTPAPSAAAPSPGPTTTVSLTPAPPVDTRRGAELDRPFTVTGVIVVSKAHPISARYVPARTSPNGLTAPAQRALAAMTAAARRAGIRVVVRSGYRSYAVQAQILQNKIREYGSETLARRYNAAAGRSEHQTGLAADLSDGVHLGVAAIRDSATGKWLWANSYRYGFILRYPPGKEKLTGYAYEPWHFRYVGKEVASAFGANSKLTLEEHLGLA